MASDAEAETTPQRFRAAKACQRCNQRRIKCDAVERGIPCSKCRENGKVECRLIKSRRGTYPRKKAKLDNAQTDNTDKGGNATPKARSDTHTTTQADHGALSGHTLDHLAAAVDAHAALAPATTSNSTRPVGDSDNTPEQVAAGVHARAHLASGSINESTGWSSLEGNDPPTGNAAPRRGAAAGLNGHKESDFASPDSNITEASTSSYREISWTAMFDHFLENRRRKRKDIIDKCSITYLGESFPLALVLDDFNSNNVPRLHHPGPPLENDQPPEEPTNDTRHPSHMLPEDIDFLKAKQAFTYPTDETLDALISTFLHRFFPLYPVVNLQEFMAQYKSRQIPWILLHAVCFVAATYCPISVLHRAGFTGRKQCRFTFYRKAKALFDTGYESNKIVILQSTILLTFWGGGPNNYWNFYSWIGTGVTIAETLGIHRSLAGTNMNKQDRSLLKRLWWILLIRDASCGALVGRPFRINMAHSDTEMLTLEDFEHDAQCPEFAKHPLRSLFGLYQIHMSGLSLILREIVITRFNPGGRSQTVANLNSMLSNWRQKLPLELKWSDKVNNLNIFASCLAIMYNHHLILTHLGRRSPESIDEIMNRNSVSYHQIPETAALKISTLASSIVTRSHVLMMPHETFHGLFIAEVVFFSQMKSPQPMVAQFGRMALNNCQIVLHEAREAWDPSPWVMKLFDNLTGNLTDETNGNSHNLEPQTEAQTPLDMNYNGQVDMNGNGNGLMDMNGAGLSMAALSDFNPIQSNNMLSAFFDMQSDADAFSALDYTSFPLYTTDLDQSSMLPSL